MPFLPDRSGPGWRSTTRIPFAVDGLLPVRHRLVMEIVGHDIAADAGYDAALVLAELVSNALKHARPLADGSLRLAWGCWDDHLHVLVTDGGADSEPTVRRPDASATGGRGLSIVRAVSTAWGVEHDTATTTVWASLPAPLNSPAHGQEVTSAAPQVRFNG